MVVFEKSKDFYKILQVPREATITEIKTSYRKLALRLHPDMHKDDPKKTAEFKKVAEAYAVLSDEEKKNAYDFSVGIRYNKNRRTAPPPNYRSVEFPKPPKHWKQVWDHKKHYDMHYGDGMYEEIMAQVTLRAKKEGLLQYRSPVGPGFAFSKENTDINRNPFSKTQQGPPQMVIEYEEAFVHMSSKRKEEEYFKKRYVHVVDNLHRQSEQRRAYQSKSSESENGASKSPPRPPQQQKENAAFKSPPQESCVIL